MWQYPEWSFNTYTVHGWIMFNCKENLVFFCDYHSAGVALFFSRLLITWLPTVKTSRRLLTVTHPLRSSDTGRGTSRRCRGLQRSQPGPGCTGACCSRPGAPPPRRPIPLPPRRTLCLPLHGCWRSASSSWRNHHRRPRWKAGLWRTLWHRRQALSWRPCCFWAFDKAIKGEGWNVYLVGGLEAQGRSSVKCHFSETLTVQSCELEGGLVWDSLWKDGVITKFSSSLSPNVCGGEEETFESVKSQ